MALGVFNQPSDDLIRKTVRKFITAGATEDVVDVAKKLGINDEELGHFLTLNSVAYTSTFAADDLLLIVE